MIRLRFLLPDVKYSGQSLERRGREGRYGAGWEVPKCKIMFIEICYIFMLVNFLWNWFFEIKGISAQPLLVVVFRLSFQRKEFPFLSVGNFLIKKLFKRGKLNANDDGGHPSAVCFLRRQPPVVDHFMVDIKETCFVSFRFFFFQMERWWLVSLSAGLEEVPSSFCISLIKLE